MFQPFLISNFMNLWFEGKGDMKFSILGIIDTLKSQFQRGTEANSNFHELSVYFRVLNGLRVK